MIYLIFVFTFISGEKQFLVFSPLASSPYRDNFGSRIFSYAIEWNVFVFMRQKIAVYGGETIKAAEIKLTFSMNFHVITHNH